MILFNKKALLLYPLDKETGLSITLLYQFTTF